ncbi:MAG: YjbQ family protein [Deltaproteobacteria bacterium]|nr:YjbQ family protein [Deltaproteobacteria bacterium]
MQAVNLYCDSLKVALKRGPDIVDITAELQTVLSRSGIEHGVLNAFVVGSTGSITTIEYEPGVVEDLKAAIDRLAPQGVHYAHEEAWHDGNGHSHVQAALLGPSINIPVRDGRLKLGTWQQAVAINHDNRARERTIEVTIVGS